MSQYFYLTRYTIWLRLHPCDTEISGGVISQYFYLTRYTIWLRLHPCDTDISGGIISQYFYLTRYTIWLRLHPCDTDISGGVISQYFYLTRYTIWLRLHPYDTDISRGAISQYSCLTRYTIKLTVRTTHCRFVSVNRLIKVPVSSPFTICLLSFILLLRENKKLIRMVIMNGPLKRSRMCVWSKGIFFQVFQILFTFFLFVILGFVYSFQ